MPTEAAAPSVGRASADPGARPTRDFRTLRHTLRGLLAATVLLPFLFLGISAGYGLRAGVGQATDLSVKIVRLAEEHALRVLEMDEGLNDRVFEVLGNARDDEIRSNQARLHQRLQRIAGDLPQLAGIEVYGAAGDLLASSRVYPVPRVSIADDDGFDGMLYGQQLEHLSKLRAGTASREPTFATLVARGTSSNHFAGAVMISLRSSYFSGFYQSLVGGDTPITLVLSRDDAALLARYPNHGTSTRAAERVLKRQALGSFAGRQNGVMRVRAGRDGTGDDIVAYRRIGNYPLYVSAIYPGKAVVGAWLAHMMRMSASTLLPSLVLWIVIAVSIRRLRAEEAAWNQWQAEAAMYRSIEVAYRQSRKMEALGQLIGSVGHDFNNLLMIVSANTQLLRMRQRGEGEKQLAAIERALKNGEALTRQLLGVTRKQPLRAELIQLDRRVLEWLTLLRSSLGAKASLNAEIRADVWTVKADPTELELALINLTVNARDAMPSGGRVTLRARNVTLARGDDAPLAGDFVDLSISDEGVGMPAEVVSRAFEPLFTTKEAGKGTGLGLPQVLSFCEQSGGIATIDSLPGHGTTVNMYLPRLPTEAAPEFRETDATRGAAEPKLRPLRVLMVEDNTDVAAGTEALLAALGHTSCWARSADAALRSLQSGERFDAVVSDTHMPGQLNGIDLALSVARC